MIRKLRKTVRELRSSTSGNAALLVALGMPALIGSAGLATDTAQWYMWKRELQFAVDQGALAGAYARAYEDSEEDYATRATQEYKANLTTISTFSSSLAVGLAKFGGSSTNNSVTAIATASKGLPFSSYLTDQSVTVRASAQASYTGGTAYTACLIAIDPDDKGSITFDGSSIILKARCGIATLSTSTESVVVNGSPNLDVGWVVSAGGIDNYFDTLTGTTVNEYLNNLIDPFAGLTPPNNATPQTYSCTKEESYNTTTGSETTVTWTETYTGGAKNKLALSATSSKASKTVDPITPRPASKSDVAGAQTGDITTVTGDVTNSTSGSGKSAVTTYQRIDGLSRVDTNYTITPTTVAAGATMDPGTYKGGVKIACDTVMNPGIYVMDGGDFEVHSSSGHTVTGNGVMIVLKNSAGIQFNGGESLNLTAMSAAQLLAAGVSSTDASRLAGILVFEDPASPGAQANHNVINGNAATVLNGTIYLPVSHVRFGGTASVTSQCLMVAAANITLFGDLDMTTFCPPGQAIEEEVSTGSASIKLVS